jgi:diguanylate cyclase (GGDEF)-like protein
MSLRRVAVIDDSLPAREHTIALLEGISGTMTRGFATLADVLDAPEETSADAIVLTVPHDPTTALAAVERLRSERRFADVPLATIVGERQNDLRGALYRAGSDHVFVRPFAREEFGERIARLFHLHDAWREAERRCRFLERRLAEQETRSRAHTKRIETLWRIANSPAASEAELLQSMLEAGTYAIRDGSAFYGQITRVEADDVVIVAGALDTEEIGAERSALLTGGVRFPLAGTAIAQVLRYGLTRAWNDLRDDPLITAARITFFGWRSAIATPFEAAGTQYVLSFFSPEPNREAFTADDHAYLELLATFFAAHFRQAWQRERLIFQNAHDGLTGVLNGAHFRSAVRTAMHDAPPFALVAVNVTDFAAVNARYGYQTGDALLVEVAAELQRRALPGDLVGRIADNTFALFVAHGVDAPPIDERIAALRAMFPRPFSTGDRLGREFVTLDARLGVARFGTDGTTFDGLLSTADAAARRR